MEQNLEGSPPELVWIGLLGKETPLGNELEMYQDLEGGLDWLETGNPPLEARGTTKPPLGCFLLRC